jgi:hypothetical protein
VCSLFGRWLVAVGALQLQRICSAARHRSSSSGCCCPVRLLARRKRHHAAHDAALDAHHARLGRHIRSPLRQALLRTDRPLVASAAAVSRAPLAHAAPHLLLLLHLGRLLLLAGVARQDLGSGCILRVTRLLLLLRLDARLGLLLAQRRVRRRLLQLRARRAAVGPASVSGLCC